MFVNLQFYVKCAILYIATVNFYFKSCQLASRKCDSMMNCMPIVVAFSDNTISFKVSILDGSASFDNIHVMYGGGFGRLASKIGEASLILKRPTLTEEAEVLYLDGYITDNGEYNPFCVVVEKIMIAACMEASKAIWR